LDSVLDAAAILDKKVPGRFCFRFVGDGPNKAALCERARVEKINNVVFEKPLPKHAIFALLQKADAFIIAAKKTDLYRYGISPNKLHKYMAATRPTVFAANSNNNPVMEASAGITVAPEDAEAVAQAIVDLATMSPEDRWKMSTRTLKWHRK
jgi:glycosyltransferase involved in cell wall biosynthesis